MRVRVDRKADAVYLDLADTAVAWRDDVAPGLAVSYDSAGRIVGVAILEASRHAADTAALGELRIDLAGAPAPHAAPAAAPSPQPAPAPVAAAPAPPPAPRAPLGPLGPLVWDPEAEAAMNRIPFFKRGPKRLAAVALTRERGLSLVTADIVAEARPMGR